VQALRLGTVRHLILDDIGSEHDSTGWWQTWLLGVIDHRYTARRPTSSSTNSPASVESRVLRRLTEFACCLELSGK